MYLFSALQGQATSCWPGSSGAPTECRQGTNVAVVAEHLERAGAHAGHDAHGHGDVGGVGELHADVRDVRTEWAHGEGDDVHRAALHGALEQAVEVRAHLGGISPVVGGAGVDLLFRTDERPVLDAGHVARVRVRPVTVGPLCVTETGERAAVDELLAEPVVLVGGPVAPLDSIRSGQLGDLVDPGQEFRVLGRRHIGGICSFVRPVSVGSNARHVPWDPPNLRT